MLKILSSGGDNASPCRTPPRHTFSMGYTVSAKRGERSCANFSGMEGWGQAGPRLLDSLLRVVHTTLIEAHFGHGMCVSARHQTCPLAVLRAQACRVHMGQPSALEPARASVGRAGAGRGTRIPLSHGYHFTSRQSYFHLSCRGSAL